jgi:hypothetical protein
MAGDEKRSTVFIVSKGNDVFTRDEQEGQPCASKSHSRNADGCDRDASHHST